MSILGEKIKNLPNTPGVYFFRNGRKVLYIGKATSLRNRVKSYFSGNILDSRGALIANMLKEATDVNVEETDSVLEALILEAVLIKKHQPPYNTRDKDNKSFNYVVITREEYPRVLLVRGRELALKWDERDTKYQFGPFPHGGQLKEALKIVRKIFPHRGKHDPARRDARRASRLNEEIGLSPALFGGKVTKKDYVRTIRNIKLFFEGKKHKLVKKLEREMQTHAKKQEFEKAEAVKRQLFALRHIRDVALLKEGSETEHSNVRTNVRMSVRVEAYDVAHTAGTARVGVMVVVENGNAQKNAYRKFKIKSLESRGDTGALKEILERRLQHTEWELPKLIVVDGAKAQKNAAERVLADFGYEISVVAVVKNERHKPKRILGRQTLISKHERSIILANSEAHRFAIAYHKKLRHF